MPENFIHVAEPLLDGNESKYVMDCLQSSWISSRGEYIGRFEQMVADFCGVKCAVAANNGTTALHLALVAMGIGPGDEVIVPTLTYIASVNAIKYCGATPVFVDSEPNYLTVDPRAIEEKITSKTKCIITVPLYGHPVDIDPIVEIANRHGLVIMEDAAEALGANYRGRQVGALANCSTFSFFGNKLITTGEGGMIVTDDVALADRMRFLRGQAVSPDKRYWHTDVGYNYRMTNVAAAIGCGQMERIEMHLQRRQDVADWYFSELASHSDYLQLPHPAPWAVHSYWMFTVLLKSHLKVDRDRVMQDMSSDGIDTRPVFYPVHWMPPYEDDSIPFPVADRCSRSGINLPTHGKLTRMDVKRVSQSLIRCIEKQLTVAAPVRRAA